MVEKGLMTELSYDFRQQHYLIGLVLCDLEAVLQNTHNASLHSKVCLCSDVWKLKSHMRFLPF